MKLTFPNEASIPWNNINTIGTQGETVLFYGRTGNGMEQRPWHGEGTWENGQPSVLKKPENLTLTHWVSKPHYEVLP